MKLLRTKKSLWAIFLIVLMLACVMGYQKYTIYQEMKHAELAKQRRNEIIKEGLKIAGRSQFPFITWIYERFLEDSSNKKVRR